MARLPRLVVPGQLHLVTQRGHRGGAVFRQDEDYRLYVEALQRAAAEQQVAVHAYALVDDGVLLLATPTGESSLGRMLQSLGRRFGAELNRRRGVTGGLWEGRYRCTVVDAPTHLLDCIRFIEAAPGALAGVAELAGYPWSSAAHHAGKRIDPLVTEHPLYWNLGNTPFDREAKHRELLMEPLSAGITQRIAEAVQKGWALGPSAFVGAMATLTSRPLAARPRGRPKKTPSI